MESPDSSDRGDPVRGRSRPSSFQLLVIGTVGLVLAGCVMRAGPLPPPADLDALALLPTMNTSGRKLLVRGDALLERMIKRRHVTVGDHVTSHARAFLRRRGYRLGVDEELPALRFEIGRWDPEGYDTSSVTVNVAARLTAPDGKEVLWEVRRAGWRISTFGAPTVSEARAQAARSIATELLASWQALDPTD